MQYLCPCGLPGGRKAVPPNEEGTSSGRDARYRWRRGLQNRVPGSGKAQSQHGSLSDAVPMAGGLSGLQHI